MEHLRASSMSWAASSGLPSCRRAVALRCQALRKRGSRASALLQSCSASACSLAFRCTMALFAKAAALGRAFMLLRGQRPFKSSPSL